MTLKESLAREPFTLALSSGFFGFFAHCGVMMALDDEDLKPEKITGSSAGAIVAAAWSHGVLAQELKLVLKELRKADFWDPGLGAGLLRGEKLEALLREVLKGRPQTTPIAISVFDIFSRKTMSFSEGDIPKFVRASVAVPLMFHPVRLGRRLYWDGGILDKMALNSVGPEDRTLVHYLPGQGLHSVYERARDVRALTPRQTMLAIDDLPRVGPNALDRGLYAIEHAYEKTRKALDCDV